MISRVVLFNNQRLRFILPSSRRINHIYDVPIEFPLNSVGILVQHQTVAVLYINEYYKFIYILYEYYNIS